MRSANVCACLLVIGAALPLAAQTNQSPHTAAIPDAAASNRLETIMALTRMAAAGKDMFATNRAFIAKAVRDRDRGVRRAASYALARSAPASLPAIRELLSDPDPKVREGALESLHMLAGFDRDGATNLLAHAKLALDDPVWIVRREAASAIQRMVVADDTLAERTGEIIANDSSSEHCGPDADTPGETPRK